MENKEFSCQEASIQRRSSLECLLWDGNRGGGSRGHRGGGTAFVFLAECVGELWGGGAMVAFLSIDVFGLVFFH